MQNYRKIYEEFYPQNYNEEKEEFSNSITQNWTEQAIECYSINSDCQKCSLSKGKYSFICQMPKIVKQLSKTYGEPKLKLA